jgi:SAM-dependent methyltransferase
VLDVGCGLGTLAAAAAARGATVTGADLAAGMLAEARRRHPQIEFVLADAEALPFADGAFDVALGAFIVNHLPHPETAAAELARVARRVALAMWGPEDEVGILGLPARAARDLDANVPPGPDAARFTDAGELARLIGGTVTELERTLHIDSLDEL